LSFPFLIVLLRMTSLLHSAAPWLIFSYCFYS
jgi:hypothetical protein